MSQPVCLLCDTVRRQKGDRLLVLNSLADPFVMAAATYASQEKSDAPTLVLAEDHIATVEDLKVFAQPGVQRIGFHDYAAHAPAQTMDLAVMNLLYQSGNAWLLHGLRMAAYALRLGGSLYVQGAKDRGILSTARRMEEIFGNVETLLISKGQRVVRARKTMPIALEASAPAQLVFADGKLDEGTRLLLDTIQVRKTDVALDIGCGAGYIGLHIAQKALQGQVTMVDASLAAVDFTQQNLVKSALTNIRVLPSDGVEAVRTERFDLVATNPPFHLGGIHTKNIAQQFIQGAAQVLRSNGRFYLVANRFLKYEPVLQAAFHDVQEVAGNNRYKVLLATVPQLL